MSDTMFSYLEYLYSGMWRLSFLGVVGNVHSHQPCIGVQSASGPLEHLLFVDFCGCPFCLLGFGFLLSF